MSSTVVKDVTPAPKPGDNALVIVVGEDGSLSVDPETLHSLINKGPNSQEVSIIRMSGSDPNSNTVDATLETFFDTGSLPPSTQRIVPDVIKTASPLLTPPHVMEELSIDTDEITRLRYTIRMDHCYTSLLSPTDKPPTSHPPIGADLVESQTLNKSTEDLMAVLESDPEPVKNPPKSVQTPIVYKINKSDVPANLIPTNTTPKLPSMANLVQTINKNFKTLTSAMAKKPLKIRTYSKPVVKPVVKPVEEPIKPEVKTAIQVLSVQKVQTKIDELEEGELVLIPPQKVEPEPEKVAKAVTTSKSLDEDLSDVSSEESDFEMDDDSDDLDFEAGRTKIAKPRYKTFGSKKGVSTAMRNKQREKLGKSPISRRAGVRKRGGSLGSALKDSPTKSLRNRDPQVTSPPPPAPPVEKEEPPPTTPETDKAERKLTPPKKKPIKPVIDDGIALFSTPDVIRRVSMSGKSDTETPTKEETTPEEPKQFEEPIVEPKQLEEPKLPDAVEPTDNSLDAGNDNTNLDLDLNADELIPEDLLFQVAKLVENADIQKVIDTNLTLVDQNLSNLSEDLPKNEFEPKPVEPPVVEKPVETPPVPAPQTPLNVNNNTSNQPIQIVRPDGRVIIIPPIEKPATRSSKRKQENTPQSTPKVVPAKIVQTTPLSSKEPSGVPIFKTLSKTEKTPSKMEEDPLRIPSDSKMDESDNSDSDDSWKSEDDPDRLWCICKQPHNNRFMICCDTCEEWFHGQCVGVSKALGRQMEQQGKEWQCPNCQKVKAPKHRDKEKNALQTALSEASATMSLTSPPATPTSKPQPETKSLQRCIVCKGPSRSGSVYCSENCIVQHSNAVERVIVFERATGRCLSGSNAPTVANLKDWLKQNPGFEVVSSGSKTLNQSKLQLKKTPTPPGTVKIVPQVPKQTPSPTKIIPKPGDPQQRPQPKPSPNQQSFGKALQQKTTPSFYGKPSPKTGPSPSSSSPVKIVQTKIVTTPQLKTLKIVQPHTITPKQPPQKLKTPTTPTTPQPQKPEPANKTPDSSKKKTPAQAKPAVTPQQRIAATKQKTTPTEEKTPHSKGPEQLRDNVRKTLTEHFSIRIKEQNEIKMTEDEIKSLSHEIESELYSLFNKDTGAKYRNRYRSLIFNIKDAKNETLWKRICQKSVSPKELVRLSPDELASQELAQWREREAKHQLDMIKKTELDLLSCAKLYVLKSHKGEEVIEKKAEAVDSTIVATLDGSLVEDTVDSTSELNRSQDGSLKDTPKSKPTDDKHKKDRHKRSRSRDRSKHRDNSRDRKRSRRRDSSRDRRSVDSKKSSVRRRSRSGSRTKSDDRHRRHDKYKSSRHKHGDKRKDSESDASNTTTPRPITTKTEDILATMGLDKKSKEILESLMDSKVVDDRILIDETIPIKKSRKTSTVTGLDSESDHEPSSTVTIATPPRNLDRETTPPLPDKNVSGTPPLDTDKLEKSSSDGQSDTSETTEKRIIQTIPKKNRPASTPSQINGATVWKGFINMIDVAKFRVTAKEVSGDCTSLSEEIPHALDIVGRISPETVWDYLTKMRRSTAKNISIIRLIVENPEDQASYQSLYTYLSSRKRFGVVKTTNTLIKDFYVMPQASYNPLPQVLLPINGPGFEEARPNLLLGILVSAKRKRPVMYEARPPVPAKRSKDSPPRSYTPPPTTSVAKDPRSRIAMPPLPSVTAVPSTDVPKPDPPVLDDLDEPYSPGDSDDALSPIAVNIISRPKPRPPLPPLPPTDAIQPVPPPRNETPPLPPGTPPPMSDLSILEPFKTSNFTGIPGLDSTSSPTRDENESLAGASFTGSLGGASNKEAGFRTPNNSRSTTVIDLDSPNSSPGVEEIPEVAAADLDVLQRNIDEINKRIEREQQAINSMSMGIVPKDDIGSGCLANIALPSNLQQILDSIKTKKPEVTDIFEEDEEEAMSPPQPSTPPPPPPPQIAPSVDEEYEPTKISYTSTTPSAPDEDSLTIPLMLPKMSRSKPQLDLNLPLNLPIPKRNLSSQKRSFESDSDNRLSKEYKQQRTQEDEGIIDQIPLQFPTKKSFSSRMDQRRSESPNDEIVIEHDDITSDEEEMNDEEYDPEKPKTS